MSTLEIKKENALKAWNNGCSDVKAVLENLLGKETFVPENKMDRVKTFEDACAVLGVRDSFSIDASDTKALTGDMNSITAYAKLIIIARAMNDGWKPDWTNHSQIKYYPWFTMETGSGLAYYDYANRCSTSFVGSRLCFKSKELAEYAGKQFRDLFNQYMNY